MITITNKIAAKLSGTAKEGLSGPVSHKVSVAITGKRDLLRLSALFAQFSSEGGPSAARLHEISKKLQIATALRITMSPDAWAKIERQLITDR